MKMEKKEVTIKTLFVKDIYDPTKMNSLIVDENETLFKTIKRFSDQPQLRGIFIVSKEKRLKGIVTRTDLLNIVKLKLGKDLDKIPLRIFLLKGLREIKTEDVVAMNSKMAYVKLDDPIEKALQLMINMDLIDVPIVDDNNNIIGDLKLSEILYKLFESIKI